MLAQRIATAQVQLAEEHDQVLQLRRDVAALKKANSQAEEEAKTYMQELEKVRSFEVQKVSGSLKPSVMVCEGLQLWQFSLQQNTCLGAVHNL